MKLSEYIAKTLQDVDFDIEVTEPNPNLCKFTYPELHEDDCYFIASCLEDKLEQYIDELDAMLAFYLGEEEAWCHMPKHFMGIMFNKDKTDEDLMEAIRENINPWHSMIENTRYLINKFKNHARKTT